ncbi:MAG: sigma-70 family RNA polymerase sigma factor [Verrucomicrobiota bacterium]
MDPVPTRQTLLIKIRDHEDNSAWCEFADLYTPLIKNFALSRGLGPEDAADVTQDTLKAVAKAIENFEYDPDKGTFRSWLYTVTRSKLNNHFAKNLKHPPATGSTAVHQIIEDIPDPSSDDERQREYWELEYKRHMFDWAASKTRHEFESNTWDAFWKTAVEQLSPAEAAEQLNLSPGAVTVAKHRVIKRLRDKIQSVTGDIDLPTHVA